jgi:hypothetical protein
LRISVRRYAALDRARGDTVSGKNKVAMNHLVTLGYVLLLAALVVADGSLALRAIDRLARSEGYTDIQNVMTEGEGHSAASMAAGSRHLR